MKQWLENWIKSREASHLQTGRRGERQALRFLRKLHYRVRGQRVRVGRHDELDIVAEHRGTLVFVEVKTRRDEKRGRPFAAVNTAKRKHLSRAAVTYLKTNKLRPDHIRFDVVEDRRSVWPLSSRRPHTQRKAFRKYSSNENETLRVSRCWSTCRASGPWELNVVASNSGRIHDMVGHSTTGRHVFRPKGNRW